MGDETVKNPSAEENPPTKFDARLAEGVAYFEQMLEIMPEDRTTLEFLVVAYDMLDQQEKGQKTLVNLAELLIKEHDFEALKGLLPRLRASNYPPAKALYLKATTLTAPTPDLMPEQPKELTEEEKTALAVQKALGMERQLLGFLKDEGILTASECDMFAGYLTLPSATRKVFLISALQILKNENVSLYEKAVELLADRFNTPPIPLAAFDPPLSLFKDYPEKILRLRGVVPFAKIGTETLVAVLNPADTELRTTIEETGPCRFYLADPSAVEALLDKAFVVSGGGSA